MFWSNALTNLAIRALLVALATCCTATPALAAEIMVQQSHDLHLDYDRRHARLTLAAMQRIWLMPGHGGTAQPVTPIGLTLSAPRFSPSGTQLIATGGWERNARHLWLIDLQSGAVTQLTDGAWRDTAPLWHPDGNHIVFTSDRGGTKDIWQLGLVTGNSIALTRTRGNAFDAAINARADQLLYAYENNGQYEIRTRNYTPNTTRARTLVSTSRAVRGPQFRRDGISVTYFDSHAGQQTLNLLLPIREMLTKPLHGGRTLSASNIAWRDRDHYYAVDNGRIVLRKLATDVVQPIPMTLWLSARERQSAIARGPESEATVAAQGEWVLRADRILAADGRSYLRQHELLIGNDRIVAVRPRQSGSAINAFDLGNATVIPGLIDVRRTTTTPEALRLAAGITLEVAARAAHVEDLTQLADNRDRLKAIDAADEQRLIVTDQLLPDALAGVDWITLSGVLPQQPGSLTPAHAMLLGRATITIPSEIAATLAGVPPQVRSQLQASRLFRGIAGSGDVSTRALQQLTALAPWLVVASGNSPVAAPLSLHAELMTMHASGIAPTDVLAMATSRAAAAIGRDDIGVIAPGKRADLVVVTGDPLRQTQDLLGTIAVVHGGRFASVARLLETGQAIVE
ncbi:MAG: amidohydrolase family protein [Pseudomonadota bacterium]